MLHGNGLNDHRYLGHQFHLGYLGHHQCLEFLGCRQILEGLARLEFLGCPGFHRYLVTLGFPEHLEVLVHRFHPVRLCTLGHLEFLLHLAALGFLGNRCLLEGLARLERLEVLGCPGHLCSLVRPVYQFHLTKEQ